MGTFKANFVYKNVAADDSPTFFRAGPWDCRPDWWKTPDRRPSGALRFICPPEMRPHFHRLECCSKVAALGWPCPLCRTGMFENDRVGNRRHYTPSGHVFVRQAVKKAFANPWGHEGRHSQEIAKQYKTSKTTCLISALRLFKNNQMKI